MSEDFDVPHNDGNNIETNTPATTIETTNIIPDGMNFFVFANRPNVATRTIVTTARGSRPQRLLSTPTQGKKQQRAGIPGPRRKEDIFHSKGSPL